MILLTGSQRYGIPTASSDFDYLYSPGEPVPPSATMDWHNQPAACYHLTPKVHIIKCKTWAAFACFLLARTECLVRQPVSKARAKAIHKRWHRLFQYCDLKQSRKDWY